MVVITGGGSLTRNGAYVPLLAHERGMESIMYYDEILVSSDGELLIDDIDELLTIKNNENNIPAYMFLSSGEMLMIWEDF